MNSIINLDRYKPFHGKWGGYVLECAKEGAIYVGISNNLDKRIKQHMTGGHDAAKFTRHYGPPTRLIELYFCDTQEQAVAWETVTSHQLKEHYKDRPVHFPGIQNMRGYGKYKSNPKYQVILDDEERRPIKRARHRCIKEQEGV